MKECLTFSNVSGGQSAIEKPPGFDNSPRYMIFGDGFSIKPLEDAQDKHDHRNDLQTPDPHHEYKEDLRRVGHVG
jgi:hypothetical protein